MPIELGYEPPRSRLPHRGERRRFALVRAWFYALFFTGVAATFGALTLVMSVRHGASAGMLGMAMPLLMFGSLAFQSVRSIVTISSGMTRAPFEEPARDGRDRG